LLKLQSKIYYRLHLFQLHFSYSYFISVIITFQFNFLFQLQLQFTDFKYFSYYPFKLQLQLTLKTLELRRLAKEHPAWVHLGQESVGGLVQPD